MAQRIRSVLQLSGPGRLIGEQLAIEAADRRSAADRAARAQSEAAQMAFRRQESEAQRQHSLDMAIEELFAQKEAASLRHSRDKEMLGLRSAAAEEAAKTAFGRSKDMAKYTHQLGFSEREAAAKAQQDHWDRMFGQQTEQTEIARQTRQDARTAADRRDAATVRKDALAKSKEEEKQREAAHRRGIETKQLEANLERQGKEDAYTAKKRGWEEEDRDKAKAAAERQVIQESATAMSTSLMSMLGGEDRVRNIKRKVEKLDKIDRQDIITMSMQARRDAIERLKSLGVSDEELLAENGIYQKMINQNIARELAKLLGPQGGYGQREKSFFPSVAESAFKRALPHIGSPLVGGPAAFIGAMEEALPRAARSVSETYGEWKNPQPYQDVRQSPEYQDVDWEGMIGG